ncbi:MAG: hypothetical protein IVW57_15735 [Ktedonobacterales bacterium]|nr:hypothetical protein [Ktedonobacterales bacterium]
MMNGSDSNDGNDGNGWDAFDRNAWGGADTDAAGRPNGTNRHATEDDEPATSEGRWVTSGGVLRWEEPDDVNRPERPNLRAEAESRWAADQVDLPIGAPPGLRIRAMRAWLARQRLLEQEAQGVVLLERRHLREGEEDRRDEGQDEPRPTAEISPLDLALAERQAAASEYERMLEALTDLESHAGQARVLVEFYLWLNERIATLALAPQAPEDFKAAALLAEPETARATPAPTPLSAAEWRGQADAVTAARRHAERVSAPEPEE